jgi:hypothetical protein
MTNQAAKVKAKTLHAYGNWRREWITNRVTESVSLLEFPILCVCGGVKTI